MTASDVLALIRDCVIESTGQYSTTTNCADGCCASTETFDYIDANKFQAAIDKRLKAETERRMRAQ